MLSVSSATVSMLATALLTVVPGSGITAPGIADFLTSIGGDTEIKTSGSMLSDPSPQLYPLGHNSSEIIGYRFFAEKLAANGSAMAERAQVAFAQECTTTGGHIEPEDGKVALCFRERMLARRLPPRGSFKHFGSGMSAVCARSPSEVMGGFVAITFDNTELATKGDFSTKLFSKILLMATRTAVYAYRPDRIPTAALFERREAALRADDAAEHKTNEAFRQTLAIGTETNCVTVSKSVDPWSRSRFLQSG